MLICEKMIIYELRTAKKNFSSGFTMIEILIAMVIIGILGVIIFVALGNQRQKARVAGAASALKGVMFIAITCKSFDGTVVAPPEGSAGGTPICSGSSQTPQGSWSALPNNCKYCELTSDELRFNCSGVCQKDGGDEDSFCNVKDGRCKQKN